MDYEIRCKACGDTLSVAGSVDETWDCPDCGNDKGILFPLTEDRPADDGYQETGFNLGSQVAGSQAQEGRS